MRARHERRIAGGPLEGTATGVIGSLAYRFADTRTQPFSVRPQFHMVFSEATGVLGLAVASVALSYHCC